MRLIVFHQEAFEQFGDWARTDKKLFERLKRLIGETAKTHSTASANPNHSKPI